QLLSRGCGRQHVASFCTRPPRLRPAVRGRPTCGRRLMRLPSSLDRLAVDSIVDAADLYAH
ncbi:hypothetical protein B296_00006293, partial [Ensete ventricosum]